jgi:hypothetical protein
MLESVFDYSLRCGHQIRTSQTDGHGDRSLTSNRCHALNRAPPLVEWIIIYHSDIFISSSWNVETATKVFARIGLPSAPPLMSPPSGGLWYAMTETWFYLYDSRAILGRSSSEMDCKLTTMRASLGEALCLQKIQFIQLLSKTETTTCGMVKP